MFIICILLLNCRESHQMDKVVGIRCMHFELMHCFGDLRKQLDQKKWRFLLEILLWQGQAQRCLLLSNQFKILFNSMVSFHYKQCQYIVLCVFRVWNPRKYQFQWFLQSLRFLPTTGMHALWIQQVLKSSIHFSPMGFFQA